MASFSSASYGKVYEYTENNRLSLLEDPNTAVDYKIELIKKARHHINILTFFWDESEVPKRMALALNEANARGVEVRILTTFIATLGTDFLGKGKKVLNTKSKSALFSYLTLTPGTKFSVTHSLHEKIFIVDGERAIIGGRNVSDSSLSGKDLEVEMEGTVVNQVQDHFKRMYDFVVTQKIDSKCSYKDDGSYIKDEACEANYRKGQFTLTDLKFFPEQPVFPNGTKARILTHEAILHQAEKPMSKKKRLLQPDDILDTVVKIDFKKLRMYNYFILPTQRYQDFLESSLAKGNSIEVITNSLESATFSSNLGYIYSLPNSLNLLNRGLEVYQWQKDQRFNYVHQKTMIFDEDHVIVGSHNLVTGSTSVSNEIAIEFISRPIAERLIEVFEREKADPKITHKADAELLGNEISQSQKKIKYLHKNIVEGFLKEIY